MHPQEPLLHHMEVHAPSQGLGPAALLWKDGRGLGHVILPLLETGCLRLCSATFEEPWSLEAPWCLQEEPGGLPADRLSPSSIWILPLAKAEGSAIHCPPSAPRLHAR